MQPLHPVALVVLHPMVQQRLHEGALRGRSPRQGLQHHQEAGHVPRRGQHVPDAVLEEGHERVRHGPRIPSLERPLQVAHQREPLRPGVLRVLGGLLAGAQPHVPVPGGGVLSHVMEGQPWQELLPALAQVEPSGGGQWVGRGELQRGPGLLQLLPQRLAQGGEGVLIEGLAPGVERGPGILALGGEDALELPQTPPEPGQAEHEGGEGGQ